MTAAASQHELTRDDKALLDAAKRGRVPELERLLDAGVDVNVASRSGQTALHLAAPRYGEATRLLLAAGANPDARDTAGATPLHGAGLEATVLLLKRGVDVNACDRRGATPLHRANAAVAEALLMAGADLHAEDLIGRSAYESHRASSRPDEALLALLEAKGAPRRNRPLGASPGWNDSRRSELEDQDLRGARVRGNRTSLRAKLFRRCDLRGVEFFRVEARRATFEHCHLDHASFGRGVFEEATLRGCTATSSSFGAATFSRANLECCGFADSALERAKLSKATVKRCCFRDTDLRHAELDGAHFTECDFSGSVLVGVTFTGSTFERCDFSGAQLVPNEPPPVEEPPVAFPESPYAHLVASEAQAAQPPHSDADSSAKGLSSARLVACRFDDDTIAPVVDHPAHCLSPPSVRAAEPHPATLDDEQLADLEARIAAAHAALTAPEPHDKLTRLAVMRAGTSAVSRLCFDPSGKHLLTMCYPDKMRVWNADTGELLADLPCSFSGGVVTPVLRADGRTLLISVSYSCMGDTEYHSEIWDWRENRRLSAAEYEDAARTPTELPQIDSALSVDGEHGKRASRVLRASSGELIAELGGSYDIALRPGHPDQLAIGASDGTVGIYRAEPAP